MKLRLSSLYVALAMIMLCVLSVNVIMERRANNKPVGFDKNTTLERSIRAQGNFTEYAPIFLIGFFVLELLSSSKMLLHSLGLIFFSGRILHFISLCYLEPLHNIIYVRVVAMSITFGVILTIAIMLIIKSFTNKDGRISN
jgi:uncharacterized membrane protein YecN with MAPEG domain